MKIRKRVEKMAPDCPRGFNLAFLVNLLKFHLALAPEVNTMADAWCKVITCGIGHI
jgi:hypothetical protein